MLIERVKSYEGDDGPVKQFEDTLEKLRDRLKKIAKYGINGRGSAIIREQIGREIREMKLSLLASGAYRHAKDFAEYRG